jgi:hypothetical protein
MVAGVTNTASLVDSLPVVINAARIVREFVGSMPKLVDRTTMPEGQGLNYDEVSLAQLTAQNITENTILDNPQQIQDTLFQITPLQSGIQTMLTDRMKRRISKNVASKIGVLAGNAMERKKDEDGLAILDGATTSLGGAGTTMSTGFISAAVARIRSNTTEPSMDTINGVLHGFQIKVIQDELVASVGATDSAIPTGLTADTFRKGFTGSVFNANLWEDGNIGIDTLDDAKGGIFAREAIVLVQGYSPRSETQRRPEYGGGADVLYMYDEYAYGERSAGNWLYEIYTDATAPTS